MDDLLAFLAWALIDVVLVKLGRLAVFALSLGRWRGERSGGNEGRIYGAAGALSFIHEGTRVITRTGLAFAGLAVLVFMVAAGLALTSR